MVKLKQSKQTNTLLIIGVIILIGVIAFILDPSSNVINAQPKAGADQTQISLPALETSNLPSFADFQAKFVGAEKTAQVSNVIDAQPKAFELGQPDPAVYVADPLPDLPTAIVQISPTTHRKVVSILHSDVAFYCDLIGGINQFTGEKGEADVYLSLSEEIRAMLVENCLH